MKYLILCCFLVGCYSKEIEEIKKNLASQRQRESEASVWGPEAMRELQEKLNIEGYISCQVAQGGYEVTCNVYRETKPPFKAICKDKQCFCVGTTTEECTP